MKQFNNDDGISGIIAGIMIFVIVVIGAMGFLMITDAFHTQYQEAANDPINSTGIFLNNTTPYIGAEVITRGMTDNIPSSILLAFAIVVIIMVFVIMSILKQE